MSAHWRAEPLCIANSCILCVNQQGSKKVSAQTTRAYCGSFSFLIVFSTHEGRWNHRLVMLGTKPKICNQT